MALTQSSGKAMADLWLFRGAVGVRHGREKRSYFQHNTLPHIVSATNENPNIGAITGQYLKSIITRRGKSDPSSNPITIGNCMTVISLIGRG